MKPVRLKFSGLQSYREEQEVSFAELGTLGIFGIFGPTGGGKSTILDAITLALYGNVERAPGGTRGIMNQFESKLTVAFEFELGKEKFLVERSYARNKHDFDSIQNKNARLVRIAGGKEALAGEVLADKAGEVNVRVEELLGMSFKDFTRAVILPQNKFDQFLKLTDSERAKMLEKIFCLEVFGEGLSVRAKTIEGELTTALDTHSKLMAQLGDASAEAIRKAEEGLAAHCRIAREKEEERRKTEDELKDLEQTAKIFEEIEELKNKLALLERQKEIMAQDKLKLGLARKAEPLRSMLVQTEDLATQEKAEEVAFHMQENRLKRIEEKFNAAQTRLAQAKEGEKELRGITETELPKIRLLQEYASQIQDVQKEMDDVNKLIKEKQAELDKITEKGQENKKLRLNIQEEIEQLSVKRNDALLFLSLREEIEQAWQFLHELETAESQAKESGKFLRDKEGTLATEEKRLRQILAERKEHFLPNPAETEIVQLMDSLPSILQKAKDELQKVENTITVLVEENMAFTLALKLNDGEPCPVCGSLHHPQLAGSGKANEERLAQARRLALEKNQELESLSDWERKAQLKYNTYQNLEQEIASFFKPGFDSKNEAYSNAQKIFEQQAYLLAQKWPAPSGQAKQLNRKEIKKLKVELSEADVAYLKIGKEIEEKEQTAKELVETTQNLRESFTIFKNDIENLGGNRNKQEELCQGLNDKIKGLTGGLSAEEFEHRVRARIQELQQGLNDAQKAFEIVEKEKKDADKVLVGLNSGLTKTREHLSKVLANLQQALIREGFSSEEALKEALLGDEEKQETEQKIEAYEQELNHVMQALKEQEEKVKDVAFDKAYLLAVRERGQKFKEEYDALKLKEGALRQELEDLRQKQLRWQELKDEQAKLNHRKELVSRLLNLLKGRRFVQFLAEEHLRDMAVEASMRLGSLTGQRYALELDDGTAFVMRDDFSGGKRRPVNSLSGGETFLTSLSLALALSSKIQLKGTYPLGFFFLDEGFGTLDQDKLELVMGALEKLHDGKRMVGVITHVPELRSRMPRYLEVMPAKADGSGSRVIVKAN